ncbi:MAG: tetratricopeptide repeat protein, partial [Verrucomicrobiota bacterium]
LRAIEQARQEAEDSSSQNAELFTARLNEVQKNLALQRERDLETMVAMRHSNRMLIIGAVLLASVGIFALLLTVYFQIRAMNRMAEITTLISQNIPFDAARALGQGRGSQLTQLSPAEPSSSRFLAALEQLEKRIHELDARHPAVENKKLVATAGTIPTLRSLESDASTLIASWLNEGQMLLNENQPEKALEKFEAVLQSEPNHLDALMKKGSALEALRQMPEALDVYDRVIAADSSHAVAYLHKGGILNRLQRFAEATECYEKALRVHPKKAA